MSSTVTEELSFVRAEDIGAFAEVRALVRLARDAAVAGAEPSLVLCAQTVAAVLVEGLRARLAEDEVLRLRQTKQLLAELRALAWSAFEAGRLSAPMFDDIMATAARGRTEVVGLEVSARRRAIARIEQRSGQSGVSGSVRESGRFVRPAGRPTPQLPVVSRGCDWRAA
jgi:hypothetical protein